MPAGPPTWPTIAASAVLEGEPANAALLQALADRDRGSSDKAIDLAFAQFSAGATVQTQQLVRRGDVTGGRSYRWLPDDAAWLDFYAEVWNSDGATSGLLTCVCRTPEGGESSTFGPDITIATGDTTPTLKNAQEVVQVAASNLQPFELEVEIQLIRLTGSGTITARALGIISRTWMAGT